MKYINYTLNALFVVILGTLALAVHGLSVLATKLIARFTKPQQLRLK